MNVLVASHPSSVEHDTSRNHPERPERVGAVLRGIDDSGLEVVTLESPEILRSELALVHDPEYIAMLETFCRLGGGALDMDTIVSSETWEASLTAAGGVAALDMTPELLQTAREQLEQSRFKDRVSFHEGDIQHLPFEDGRFDLVWSSRTIHHLPDQLVGVREVARVIKPGGRFALR
ncbi:MAG: methyltransferase domain-containing protein, partial [Chloroflexi bacterium]|nr:methyltransferase domain-containing protein [Chloroflexota bacterium]